MPAPFDPTAGPPAARVDDLCDRFEAALAAGDRRPLGDWLAEAGPLAEAALPELAAVELNYRLAAGEPATAADYMMAHPALRTDPETAVRLVAVEFQAAVARDPSVTEADFRRRYPDLAAGPAWSNGPWVDLSAGRTDTVRRTETWEPASAVRGDANPLAGVLGPPDSERPGDLGTLGDYRVERVLGRGGMGAVLRAYDTALRRVVAIKVMLPDVAARPGAADRFLREARAAAAVDHPRVVPIHHVGQAGGVPYIVMPLLKGRSLAARLAAAKKGTEHPIDAAEAVWVGREVAEGLAAAHAAGLVHRDLKPDNVWLEDGPDGVHVRLLDFGLARAADGADLLTRTGTAAGTPAYMSPEQAGGRAIDARTDLWSLGVVAYELAAGRRPFDGPDVMAVLTAIATRAPEPLARVAPDVPADLAALVGRLLAKDPSGRPGSAEEVGAELKRIAAGLAARQRTVTFQPPGSQPRPGMRGARWVWPAVVAAVLAGGAGVWFSSPPRDRESDPIAAGGPKTPPTPASKPVPDPLRIQFIKAGHIAVRRDKKGEGRGPLGKESFGARLGDQLSEVEVELSRPGYAYLVAFRPDGVAEPIFPADPGQPPTLSPRPRYPSTPAVRADAYGLEEGVGLWVFAAAASDRPLPAYRDAIAGKPSPPRVAGGPADTGVVWWDDGRTMAPLTAAGGSGQTRAAGADSPAKAGIQRATDWLKAVAGEGAEVAAIGFEVRPRE